MHHQTITIGTLGDCIDHGYKITAYCNNPKCRHDARLDLPALAERLGRDQGSLHHELLPKLKCAKCGGKDLGMILQPPVLRVRMGCG